MNNYAKTNLRTAVLVLIILLTAATRLFPLMPNFSPLAAMSLFGAAYLSKRWQVFLVPAGATWLSDLYINNVVYAEYYPSFTWFYEGFYWQYGSYIIIAIIGRTILRKLSLSRITGGALFAAMAFFIISNFGVWLESAMYPKNVSGLISCYIAGIPFLKGTLYGTLFYSGALFGMFYFIEPRLTGLREASV